MNGIDFPSDFPETKTMMDFLKKTFEKSWKVELDIENVILWLENFSGKIHAKDVEQRLALWMLCNFTYYNEIEVKHLCSVLFKNFVHQLIIDNNFTDVEKIKNGIDECYFTSIGSAGESGGLMLYHFRQEANLSIDRFFFPTTLNTSDNDIIVCIDDVMLSGGTASRFFYKILENLKCKKIYYLTLITCEEAITKLENLGVSVIYCASLDNRNKIFSDESLCFYKFHSLKGAARTMAETYGKDLEPQNPLGYKDGQYSFGFYYNIPNNSLPIFWSSNNWNPILQRKEKLQNVSNYKREFNHFI